MSFLPFFCVALPSGSIGQSTGFIENKGQIVDQNNRPNPGVLYLFNSRGMNVQLRRGGFSYDVYTDESVPAKAPFNPEMVRPTGEELLSRNKPVPRHYHRIDIDLEGADWNHGVVAEEKSEAYFNYYLTKEPVLNVHKYNRVTYTDVYPGIDLVFTAGNGKPFEYTFVVKPGASVADIRLRVSGADSLTVNEGGVRYATSLSLIDETLPRCWYMEGGKEHPLDISFKQKGYNTFGFGSDTRVPENALVYIDPMPSRVWGTYFGGEGEENLLFFSHGDSKYSYNYIVLAGHTQSTSNVATEGTYMTVYTMFVRGFITKFSLDGMQIWGTYIDSYMLSYTLDPFENIFVCGEAGSGINMITPGAWQPTNNFVDGFLARFSRDGYLQWGTYYGGSNPSSPLNNYDCLYSVSTDMYGNVYALGATNSIVGIASPGAYQTSPGGMLDCFVVKFSHTGQRYWATYFGGNNKEYPGSITTSASGLIYFTGATYSTTGIATPGAFISSLSGNGFLACFSTNGNLNWCTYISMYANTCQADTGECVYITGNNDQLHTIGTPGTYQSTPHAANVSFLAKFDNAGNRLWGTYFGWAGLNSLFVDSINDIYVAGNAGTYDPVVCSPGTYHASIRGSADAYFGKFGSGGQFYWGSYYGGTDVDYGLTCFADAEGDVFLSGYTASLNQTPSLKCMNSYVNNDIASPGAFSGERQGISDFFMARFTMCPTPDTASGIYGPRRVCVNSTGHLFSIDSIPNSDTIIWCVSNGLTITAGQGTTSITVNAGSVARYDTVAVHGENSCGEGFAVLKIVQIIAPQPTLSGPDTVCCFGDGSYYTEPEYSDYYWTFSPGGTLVSGGSSTDNFCTINWNVTGNQWVKVAYTDGEGCTTIDTAMLSVVVPELHPVSGSITQQGAVCEGSEAVFIATPEHGGTEPGYDWFVNGMRTFSGSSVFSYWPVQGDVITCRLTSSYTLCVENNPAMSNPLTVDIHSFPPQNSIRHE